MGLFSLCLLILALSAGSVGVLCVSYLICCLFVSVQHFWIACYIYFWLCPVGSLSVIETGSHSNNHIVHLVIIINGAR